MYVFITLILTVLILSGGVYTKKCPDCMNYNDCPDALELASYKPNDQTGQLFKDASCGYDRTKQRPIPKVCCSDFAPKVVETDEDRRIDNHKNQNLLPADCGVIKGDRIVGGSKADLYEFPWMALISHSTRDGPAFKCGGSIINSRYVLTAAHCVHNKPVAGVRVGEYDINEEYDCQGNVCENHIEDLQVEKIIVHPEYKAPNLSRDIALLRLKSNIEFGHKNIDTICLPRSTLLRSRSLGDKPGTVTGWGLTENKNYPSILLKVTIPIHTAEKCSSLYNKYTKPGAPDVTANKLCAGTINKDSCNGDSGGPLMFEEKYKDVFRYVQYGVVSHGPVQCGSTYPGVYTDVTKYMGWILDNMAP